MEAMRTFGPVASPMPAQNAAAPPKADAAPAPAFAYDGLSLSTLKSFDFCTAAQMDGKTGKQANQSITPIYSQLSKGLADYMGEPALPNWATFGQYASRYAGTSIAELEDAQKVTDVLASPTQFLRHPIRQIHQLLSGLRGAFNDRRNGDTRELATQGKRMLGAQVDARNPLSLVHAPGRLNDSVGQLQSTLKQGNEGIVRNIAPAIDTFLKAEAHGKNGLEALKAGGFGPGTLKDPNGFIYDSFVQYQQARVLGQRAQGLPDGDPAKQSLLAERQSAVNRANLYLGLQEQLYVLQPILDSNSKNGVVAKMQGAMAIEDPNGRYPLLPNGGNWQDFATRMGFVAAQAGEKGAIAVKQGKTTQFYKVPSPPIAGTISAYFERGLDPRYGNPLLAGRPTPLI